MSTMMRKQDVDSSHGQRVSTRPQVFFEAWNSQEKDGSGQGHEKWVEEAASDIHIDRIGWGKQLEPPLAK